MTKIYLRNPSVQPSTVLPRRPCSYKSDHASLAAEIVV
jgi:hypothetical protein